MTSPTPSRSVHEQPELRRASPPSIDLAVRGADLKTRHRIGFTVAIVALGILLSHVSVQVRVWLRDGVVGGMPYWLDKMTVMMALKVGVWALIGGLLLGWRGLALRWPTKQWRAWAEALGSGLVLVTLVAGALAVHGGLTVHPHVNPSGMAADIVSNLWEELAERGAILGLLLAALGRPRAWLAMGISAALFCQGHLYHPPAMLALTFGVGLLWAWMTIRHQSLWPAYVSHTVIDLVAESLFL